MGKKPPKAAPATAAEKLAAARDLVGRVDQARLDAAGVGVWRVCSGLKVVPNHYYAARKLLRDCGEYREPADLAAAGRRRPGLPSDVVIGPSVHPASIPPDERPNITAEDWVRVVNDREDLGRRVLRLRAVCQDLVGRLDRQSDGQGLATLLESLGL